MLTKEFTNIDGKKRVFEFKSFLCPTGFVYEATEIQNGESKGMRFSVLGGEGESEVLRHKLQERIKKALSMKHVEYNKESNTWVTCNHTIRGQIRWDANAEFRHKPLILVDGHELTWEQFGKAMLVYEGFQFLLRFVDASEDVCEADS